MRNPERGASQVPFVVCLVLLLIVGFLYYNENGERVKVEGKLSSIVSAAKDADSPGDPSVEKIKDLIAAGKKVPSASTHLKELVGVTGAQNDETPELVISSDKLVRARDNLMNALDKGEFTIDFPVDRFIDPGDKDVKVIKGESKYTVSYGGTRDLRGAAPTVESVFNVVIEPAMRRMVADIARYRDAYVQAMSQKEQAEAAYRTALAAKDGEIQSKIQERESLEQLKATEISNLRRERDEANQAKQSAEEDLQRQTEELTTQIGVARRELDQKTAEVQILKQQKRAVETDTSPDGTVLATGSGSVVIDLGKVDNNLIQGTNFDVYGIGKGGTRIPKGVVKVVSVDAHTSQARIIDQFDRFEPIIAGDKIMSLTYDPARTIHVALVGRFTRMGKSDAARRLEALGVVVDAKVGVSTTYLVVGSPESDTQPIEETDEFKTAQMYGVPTISENELSRFTMY